MKLILGVHNAVLLGGLVSVIDLAILNFKTNNISEP